MQISKQQAARFMLKKQGLLGAERFHGSDGMLEYVRNVGCVQFDPVDVCGKSHELAFLARVSDFSRDMLDKLLYQDRVLFDYYDKNMCIMCVEDWPYLSPMRRYYAQNGRSREEVERVAPMIRRTLRERGCATSQELELEGRADWYWSETTLSRAALETLYYRGELVVHHKRGAVKSYALAETCLPRELLEAENPLKTELAQRAWHTLRRVGAIGLLWNAASDAWLGIDDMKAANRNAVFEKLIADGAIVPTEVEGLSRPLYLRTEDMPLLKACEKPFGGVKRVRFLPPLDCMLWDRKLIGALFDFWYRWEIYTPKEQCKYAHYTLPVLYGERFAGRIAPVCDRKRHALVIRNFWPETGFRVTDAFMRALEAASDRLRVFHGLERVEWDEGAMEAPDTVSMGRKDAAKK